MDDETEERVHEAAATPTPPAAPKPPRYQLPSRAPTAADLDDLERFRKLSSGSLADVRAAAEKWRTGLAALITLITGGLLIKGPESAADLTTHWRVLITILAGGGIAVAIFGLWQALKASAGLPKMQKLDSIVAERGSVLAWEIHQADNAAGQLRFARGALMVSLPLLGAALIFWWWAPKKPSSPPASVEVSRMDGDPVCGTLKSGDNGHLVVQVAGDENPTTIPYAAVKNVGLKASC